MTRQRTTLLHVTTRLRPGGVTAGLRDVLVHVDRYRHHVVSLMPREGLAEEFESRGVEVSDLGIPAGSVRPRAVLELARIIRRSRPSLVQGWAYHGNVVTAMARLLARSSAPMVWAVHHSLRDISLETRNVRLSIRLGRTLAKSADRIIYVSRTSAAQHEEYGYPRTKSVFIPNGIDCERFRPDPDAKSRLAHDLAVRETRCLIGLVARAHPMKDHDNAFRAIRQLLDAGHDVHLVALGRDVTWAHEELARAAGNARLGPDRLSLLGERADVADLMPGFDTLMLPSSWGEAFPYVLGEAMACGVPCVTTDVGDSGWIVGDTGVVVPPRDPEALAAGLARLIELGAAARARLGAAARSRITDNFQLAEVCRQYEALYEDLAALPTCISEHRR